MELYFNKIFIAKMTGVKCDADGCDYNDDSAVIQDYKSYINKPCPKCGAPLLTQKDADLINIILKIERVLGWIRIPSFKPPIKFDCVMDGTGNLSYK